LFDSTSVAHGPPVCANTERNDMYKNMVSFGTCFNLMYDCVWFSMPILINEQLHGQLHMIRHDFTWKPFLLLAEIFHSEAGGYVYDIRAWR
jgi:hypothetical protein